MKQWPKLGTKVTYKGTTKWFFFNNILKDANELLEVGKVYTITGIELASSWCGVQLAEFPDKKFSLSWFDYEEELTTEEVMKNERDEWGKVKYEFTSLEEFSDKAKENKVQDLIKGYDIDVSPILKKFNHKLKEE